MRRSPARVAVVIGVDLVVAIGAVVAVVQGDGAVSMVTWIVALVALTLAALYPGVAVTSDGVRLRGLADPIPWSQVEAFNPTVSGRKVLVVQRGRVAARLMRGARQQDLAALDAWLAWSRR